MELLFWSQNNLENNVLGHPVVNHECLCSTCGTTSRADWRPELAHALLRCLPSYVHACQFIPYHINYSSFPPQLSDCWKESKVDCDSILRNIVLNRRALFCLRIGTTEPLHRLDSKDVWPGRQFSRHFGLTTNFETFSELAVLSFWAIFTSQYPRDGVGLVFTSLTRNLSNYDI